MKKNISKIIFVAFLIDLLVPFFADTGLFGAETKGSVSGTVRYSGATPPHDSASVKTDSEICGSNYSEETLINLENKGVKNAVISLKKKIDEKKPLVEEKRIYLISKKCHLEPYVTIIQQDESLSIENSDPILHVFKFSKEDQVLFTLPLSPNGHIVKKIDQLGLIQIKCVLHPFMKSFVAVLDTPIYTLSDFNGLFHLPEIDPGKYILSIWLKGFVSIEKEIEVPPGKNLNLIFELEQK